MSITFDTSVPQFVALLTNCGVNVSEANGAVVRDIRGRLSFISSTELADTLVARVGNSVTKELAPYISPIGPIADKSAPGADRVLREKEFVLRDVTLEHHEQPLAIKLIDRRAVGVDWLHVPESLTASPPRLVFASLKGGVGRSTALSVLAAELAERGHSLLVLDLDLEAPGVGSMLIESTATPRFGALDFFVEDALRSPGGLFLDDCVAASWLGGGRGRVDVVPSIGTVSLDNPKDVLSKLARAYVEGEDKDGNSTTFLNRLQEFISRLSSRRRYDAILVDARAGLHETTASSMLGLGADVLLFGVDQPQTLLGYKILLSHLSQLPVVDSQNDWRYRFRMVQAKVDSEAAIAEYRTRAFDVFDSVFYDRANMHDADILGEGFRFSIDDQDGPHFAIPVYEDERYRLFDPVRNRSQLTKDVYSKGFSSLIQFCVDRLQLNEEVVS